MFDMDFMNEEKKTVQCSTVWVNTLYTVQGVLWESNRLSEWLALLEKHAKKHELFKDNTARNIL